jgi:hypothetical protein
MNFHIEDDTLTIIFEGVEQLWALRRTFIVPKVNIMRAMWQETFTIRRWDLGWRFGTAMPGILFAGTYIGNAGRNFIYLQRPQGFFGEIKFQNVLVLELRNAGYRRVLITVNKPEIAEQIIAWWSSNI